MANDQTSLQPALYSVKDIPGTDPIVIKPKHIVAAIPGPVIPAPQDRAAFLAGIAADYAALRTNNPIAWARMQDELEAWDSTAKDGLPE